MLKIIRNLLAKIIDDIDAGNSNITEDEAIKLIGTLKELTDKEKRLSKYAACRYLNKRVELKVHKKVRNYYLIS